MERLGFTFYDPVPTIAPPNDDLELQLVWLHLVEQAGATLTQADFARAWLDHIHYMWDEYGRCRWNLRRGVPVDQAGTFENHFVSGMGSPIRSEIWACLFPGDPESAAYYAALDASLDHGADGIDGEVFFAVMQSLAAAGETIPAAIAAALRFLDPEGATARAIRLVVRSHQAGQDAWECWRELMACHGNENFTHAPLNVALTVWALCHGDGDFEKSILLGVNGGYDTDCTAATVGATLGLRLGREAIPARWAEPIGEGVYIGPGIQGIRAPETLAELTERTEAMVGKLQPRRWTGGWTVPAAPGALLEKLPGTIRLRPLDGGTPVPWANGELPRVIKAAGGACWEWTLSETEQREIICLARGGARLFLDEELILECPPGLPYVPATHRSPEGSRVSVGAAAAAHVLRVELHSRDADQEASVLMAYPNMHIAPWTAAELPHPAKLPAA